MPHDHLPPVDPDAPLPTHYSFCKTPGCPELISQHEDPLCPRCQSELAHFDLERLMEADYIPLDGLIRAN
ncbi:MAG: hypothetical protein IT186_10175 [Acidobacteria bacterium]|nr:hypothetical protein [Acidobacteriota bacterium]MCG3193158.1 hypothetical protein [Thermoanaerobaculia bacterium]MCK6685379.1 hypothetical protein [Thermoanaerobaculia bacterium]